MCLTLLSYGAWYSGDLELAVLFTAMSFFLSWPFAALVGELQGVTIHAVDIKTKIPFLYEAHVLNRNFCFDVNGRFGL